ncbi:hypothetical protein EON65_17235 [archaeon]|nr:MAG: hypothetical protein EON65_17235 [archaeon]
MHVVDLSSQAVSQAAIILERVLFTFSRMFVTPPRFLNPKQESYWICQYLIEHLFKMVSTL